MINYFKTHYNLFIQNYKEHIKKQFSCKQYEQCIDELDIMLFVCPQNFISKNSESSEESDMNNNASDAESLSISKFNKQVNERVLQPNHEDVKKQYSPQACIITTKETTGFTDSASDLDLFLTQKQSLKENSINGDEYEGYGDISDYFALNWSIRMPEKCDAIMNFLLQAIVLDLKTQIHKLGQLQNQNLESNIVQIYFDKIKETYHVPNMDVLTKLASLNYENRKNTGVMSYLKEGTFESLNEQDKTKILSSDVNINRIDLEKKDGLRYLRKILEISNSNYKDDKRKCVILDKSNKHIGFSFENVIKESNLLIYFDGSEKWKLQYNDIVLLGYDFGKFYIGDNMTNDDNVDSIPYIQSNKKQLFSELFECLKQQSHGALVILTNKAKDEVDRLCLTYNRGTKIKSYQLTKDNLSMISGFCSVDGAIFIDYEGNCHGYGVVLDGEAKIVGNLSRGSRFNSAANYVSGTEDKYAIVVSEDKEKGLEILPPN